MSRVHFVTQAVAQQVESEACEQNCPARCSSYPPLVEYNFTAFGDHRAPFRRWRLNAHAEKTKPGRSQNNSAEAQRSTDYGTRQAQRQNMPEHQAQSADALHTGRGQ